MFALRDDSPHRVISQHNGSISARSAATMGMESQFNEERKKLRSLEEEANVVEVQLRDQEAVFYQTELLSYLTTKRQFSTCKTLAVGRLDSAKLGLKSCANLQLSPTSVLNFRRIPANRSGNILTAAPESFLVSSDRSGSREAAWVAV